MSKIKSGPRVQRRAREAGEIAAMNVDTSVNWIALRAENARRTAVANGVTEIADRTWLMNAVSSTPFATVIAS